MTHMTHEAMGAFMVMTYVKPFRIFSTWQTNMASHWAGSPNLAYVKPPPPGTTTIKNRTNFVEKWLHKWQDRPNLPNVKDPRPLKQKQTLRKWAGSAKPVLCEPPLWKKTCFFAKKTTYTTKLNLFFENNVKNLPSGIFTQGRFGRTCPM